MIYMYVQARAYTAIGPNSETTASRYHKYRELQFTERVTSRRHGNSRGRARIEAALQRLRWTGGEIYTAVDISRNIYRGIYRADR